MKRKFAALFLAMVLAVSATACTGNTNTESTASQSPATSTVSTVESKDESKNESKSENESSKADESSKEETTSSSDADVKDLIQTGYIDIVKDGKYYIKMNMDTSAMSGTETSGVDIPESITMTIATDASNKKMYMDMGMSMLGFSKIIVADGKQWMLSDENKAAYYTETTSDVESQFESLTGTALKTDGIKYVSDSEKEFNGKQCIAVVYNVPANNNLTTSIASASAFASTDQTYYFDKSTKELVGITVDANGTKSDVIIEEITKDIPDGLFDIPSDYTQTDLSAMTNTLTSSKAE